MCAQQLPSAARIRRTQIVLAVAACLLLPGIATAQGLMGALIGTVKDEQGGVLAGARVRISSPALIGGPETLLTSDKGQLRFPSLPPGLYALAIELQGFMPYHEDEMSIGAGATIERTAVLKVAGLAESVVVEGAGTRIDARNPGFGTRFGSEDIDAIPTRRASMYDFVRASPGVSPTSPSSGVATTISAFGSGTNENQFLIDGMNTTCPCSGVARTEPGLDFIHEVQVSAVGTSAEFGNMQGGGDQRRHQARRRAVPLRRFVLRTGVRAHEPAGQPQVSRLRRTAKRLRAREVRGLHEQPRRSCHSRSTVVLRWISVAARLRQPAGHRSHAPAHVRDAEIFREAHLAARARVAAGAKLSRRDRDRTRAPDHRHPVRSNGSYAHLGADDELRRSHAHDVGQHSLGCSRRPVCFPPERRPERTESDNAKPVRPCHRRHHRRETERRSRRPVSGRLPRRPSRTTGAPWTPNTS